MTNLIAFILAAGLLAACAPSGPVAHRDPNDHRGYAADAMRCSQAAMRKEEIKVPTPHALSVIEIPTIPDAGRFTACMDYARWPVPRMDTTKYLDLSTACLNRARRADNADETYANCIKASQLSIELVPNQ